VEGWSVPDPAFDTVHKIIMKSGSHRFGDPADVYNAIVIVRKLKEQGHAMLIDETFDDRGKFLEAHVIHYLGCKACKSKGGSDGIARK
jgi:hypothetical protein